MEWIKIDGETYKIVSILVNFSSDNVLKSELFIDDPETESAILAIYDDARHFEFETREWRMQGASIRSITFDTHRIVVGVTSSIGGMKSRQHERDRRIDELLDEGKTSDGEEDITTNQN